MRRYVNKLFLSPSSVLCVVTKEKFNVKKQDFSSKASKPLRKIYNLEEVRLKNHHSKKYRNKNLIYTAISEDTLRLAAKELKISPKNINFKELGERILTLTFERHPPSREFKIVLKAVELTLLAISPALSKDNPAEEKFPFRSFKVEGTLAGDLSLNNYLNILKRTKRIVCPKFLDLLDFIERRTLSSKHTIFEKFVLHEYDLLLRQPKGKGIVSHPFLKLGRFPEIVSLRFSRKSTTVYIYIGLYKDAGGELERLTSEIQKYLKEKCHINLKDIREVKE